MTRTVRQYPASVSTTLAEIGRTIQVLRVKAGKSQDQLAADIGATHVTVGRIERCRPGTEIGNVLTALDALGFEVVVRPKGRKSEKRQGLR